MRAVEVGLESELGLHAKLRKISNICNHLVMCHLPKFETTDRVSVVLGGCGRQMKSSALGS